MLNLKTNSVNMFALTCTYIKKCQQWPLHPTHSQRSKLVKIQEHFSKVVKSIIAFKVNENWSKLVKANRNWLKIGLTKPFTFGIGLPIIKVAKTNDNRGVGKLLQTFIISSGSNFHHTDLRIGRIEH